MHKDYIADSYEYAKRVLLHKIAPPNKWVIHPMLFRSKRGRPPGGGLNIGKYADFLELPHKAVLPGNARIRKDLVRDVAYRPEPYLFLDPDTGLT